MGSHDLESDSEKSGVPAPNHDCDVKNPPASEDSGDKPAVVDFPEGGLKAWSVVFGA